MKISKKDLYVKKLKVLIKYHKLIRKNKKAINSIFDSKLEIDGIDAHKVKNKEQWKRVLLGYNKFIPHEALIIAEHFANCKITLEKRSSRCNIEKNELVLICNVKDDLRRIQMLISHHRQLGVKHFAIIDNDSKDGTYEWLLQQDIDLFCVKEKYNSVIRAAWIAQLVEYYGLNRWYLILDSDELLVYEGMEHKSIQQLLVEMEEKHISRGLGFMIDMYAESSNLKQLPSEEDIFEKYCYFDTQTYYYKKHPLFKSIHGGPRERIFGKQDREPTELLTKYPIIYWEEGELYRYHYMFPFEKNFDSPCFLGLFHYKFLDGDYDKYSNIANEGNYAGGSKLYKKYLSKIGEEYNISFMDKQSQKYQSSLDLRKINIFKKI